MGVQSKERYSPGGLQVGTLAPTWAALDAPCSRVPPVLVACAAGGGFALGSLRPQLSEYPPPLSEAGDAQRLHGWLLGAAPPPSCPLG